MKIRSVAELTETLDSSSAWRKKEMTTLRILIATRGRSRERAALRRSAVPILYGHWEGFAKQAAAAYLDLVRRQQRSYRDLELNFLAMAVRGALREATDAAKSRCTSVYIEKFSSLMGRLDERVGFANRAVNDAVSSDSNLSARVLQDVLATIGIPYDRIFRGKALLIDASLLAARNGIAHGERVEVDSVTYRQLHELVVELVDHLKDVIVNHARDRRYLIAHEAARSPAVRE